LSAIVDSPCAAVIVATRRIVQTNQSKRNTAICHACPECALALSLPCLDGFEVGGKDLTKPPLRVVQVVEIVGHVCTAVQELSERPTFTPTLSPAEQGRPIDFSATVIPWAKAPTVPFSPSGRRCPNGG